MPATSGPYSLLLNTLQKVPDPTAQWGNPATRVQIANASPFILNVSIAGEVTPIQSFTAQTFDTSRDGAGMTLLPTSGPATSGAQGQVTVVWLLAGENPPQADGQLTGAAQYAVGLGSQLFTGGHTGSAAFNVPITPNTRTILIAIPSNLAVTNVQVLGLGGLTRYYNNPPYIDFGTFDYLIVVPIVPLIDAAAGLQVAVTTAGVFTITVWGDTAQYAENIFYNGPSTPNSGTLGAGGGTTAIATGPCRLLSGGVRSLVNSAALIFSGATGETLSTAGGAQSANFGSWPPYTKLEAGQTLNLSMGAGAGAACTANVLTAYP